MQQIQSINFMKGLLIILVILGHLIPGNLKETLSRYFIYSFHMPLFIGISGYLFNFDKLFLNKNNFLKSFFKRIIIPYIIANIFYCIFINLPYLINLNIYKFIFNFIKNSIYSYYHLWYIQGFISYALILYFLLKKNFNFKLLVSISFIISFTVYYFYFHFHSSNPFLRIFLNNFRLYNLIFFTCGFIIKKYNYFLRNNCFNFLVFVSLFLMNSIATFYLKNEFITMFLFYISNLYSILYILTICITLPTLDVNLINDIGKNSLYIYLYHIAPILILKKLYLNDFKLYYFFSLVIFILGVFTIKTLDKAKI
ncbi:acyltransferase family protein [Cetobacterium somerae]|uniref:acyltransferase family protein n=1 Tax=Cetobacterium somerae TaxID=188913 RepID=UPI00248E7518|nr:acyltransferase [Cetobacterium somerae]